MNKLKDAMGVLVTEAKVLIGNRPSNFGGIILDERRDAIKFILGDEYCTLDLTTEREMGSDDEIVRSYYINHPSGWMDAENTAHLVNVLDLASRVGRLAESIGIPFIYRNR